MKTQHIHDRLSEYIDGSMNSRDQHMVRVHLVSCEMCRKEYESLRALVQEVHELPTKFQLPETFFLNVDRHLNDLPHNESEEPGKRKNGAAVVSNMTLPTKDASLHNPP